MDHSFIPLVSFILSSLFVMDELDFALSSVSIFFRLDNYVLRPGIVPDTLVYFQYHSPTDLLTSLCAIDIIPE